mgnify:CR=1 FL=1
MPNKTIRFICEICNETIALSLDEAFQQKFTATADKIPYPLVYPHKGHFAIVFLDKDFVERGVTTSKMVFE